MAEIITSEIEIQSGVTSSGLTVEMGGVVTVLSGGIVTDAEAVNYGWFWVEEGGHISNIHLTHSGDAMVDGGLAENLTMESGGQADIFGGTMRTGTILNGGYGAIYETGSGLDVAVSAGGRYLVYGGYAENTIISSGGSLTVQLNSGLADKTTIEAGGHARITSDGQMWETILNGGRLDVISGTIRATTINGGELHVSSDSFESAPASGYAENTIVNAGAFIVSGATATDTTLNGGAFIVSGGLAQKTTVNGGDFIASDATVQSTTVSGGEFIASDAEVQSTTVSGGAVQFIGGFADKTDIFSGTVLVSGGTVQNTTLGSGTSSYSPIVIPVGPVIPYDPIVIPVGPVIPYDPIVIPSIIPDPTKYDFITGNADGSVPYLIAGGATVSLLDAAAITAAGGEGNPVQVANAAESGEETSFGTDPAARLTLLNGALAVSTTVNSGLMQVFEGGVANETTVKGGTVHISGGGIANNITMSSGGGSFIVGGDTNTYGAGISFNPVYRGGTPFVTVFEGGGLLTLDGGTANNVTLAGGTFHVSSGGIAVGTTVNGGLMQVFEGGLANAATINGGITFVNSGGVISGITANSDTLRVSSGGILTGNMFFASGADVTFEEGGILAFDITVMAPGAAALVNDLTYLNGTPVYTLTVSDTQAEGVYTLAAEATGFRDAITVQNQFGAPLGTLAVGNAVLFNNQYYTLRVTDNVLNLKVSSEAPVPLNAPKTVYVNADWAGLEAGTVVEVGGGLSAAIGLDAFSDGRSATNAVAGDGTVIVTGGDVGFEYGISRNTVALEGATVSQCAIVRNGTLTMNEGSLANGLTVSRLGTLALNTGSLGRNLTVSEKGTLALNAGAFAQTVTANGIVTVNAGGALRDVVADSGSTVTVNEGGTLQNITVKSGNTGVRAGGILRDLTMLGGNLTIEEGGVLTGTGTFSGGYVSIRGTLDFDISGLTGCSSPLFTGLKSNTGFDSSNLVITVNDAQAPGAYCLASAYSNPYRSLFNASFTVVSKAGETLGTITVGGGVTIDGHLYTLDFKDVPGSDSLLTLTVRKDAGCEIAYVNSEWADLEFGTVVEVPGGTAVIGDDAFSLINDAIPALQETGTIVVTGGSYSGEKISRKVSFRSGTLADSAITANGILNFEGTGTGLTVRGGILTMMSGSAGDNITVEGNGGTLNVNTGASVRNGKLQSGGSGTIRSGGVCTQLTVSEDSQLVVEGGGVCRDIKVGGGTFTVRAGGVLTGTGEFKTGSVITVDGLWFFDISTGPSQDALFKGLALVNGTPDCVITVSDAQAYGIYKLADGLPGLPDTFRIVNTAGTELGAITVGESVVIGKTRYTLNLSGPAELNLTVRGKDSEKSPYVYVNSDWAGKEFGSIVYVQDVGNVVIGFNAFSDLKDISDYVTEIGTVTVVGGLFSGVEIDRNVFVTGGTITDSVVIGTGALTLNSGATARDITVSAGSLLTVNAGATLTITSSEFLNPDAVITIRGKLLLDISGRTPGDPAFIDASRLPEGSTIKVDIGSSLPSGVYSLVSNMTEFNGVEIYRNGVYFKTLSALDAEDLNYSTLFSMKLTMSEEDPTLRLVLRQYLNYWPCVNTEWAGLEYGTAVVSPDGYTYTYGYDAFATYEEAEFVTFGGSPGVIMIFAENNCISPAGGINKTCSLRSGRIENTTVGRSGSLNMSGAGKSAKNLVVDGMLIASSQNIMQNVVVNGTLQYSGESTGPQHDITVTESGTLVGWTTFSEDCGITVDGYLRFTLGFDSSIQGGVRYRNLYNLKGNTKYSVSIGSDTYSNQRYTLATGFVGSEDTSFVFVNSLDRYLGEIRLGKSAIVEKNVFTMTVEKDETTGEDCLVLTITQKGETLYLSSEWEGVEDGKVVQYPVMYGQIWGKAVMGESAFSDGDLAMEKAYGIDTIQICCGTFSFSEGITTQTKITGNIGNMMSGDVLIHNTEIAASLTIVSVATTGRNLTVLDCGSLSAGSGALLDSITVRSGGQVSVGGGATLTGRCVFEDGSGIKLESNASLVFDVTGMTAGGPAQYEGFGCVQWKQSATPIFTLAVSGTQEYGDYLLATGVTEFAASVSITVNGAQVGSVSTAEKTILNGATYALKVQDDSLVLKIAEYVQPSVIYLNSDWKKTPADTVVEVPGGTAVFDSDAFAELGRALVAAGSVATVAITGGTFVFADGIDSDVLVVNGAVHDSVVRKSLTIGAGASAWNLQVAAGATLTVEAGAKLTGWAVFAEGANITVDGTLDFDLSKLTVGSAALYEGLSYVQGDTAYTLTVRAAQTPGFYYLAYGADGFKSAITLTATDGTALGTLRAGMSTRIGDVLYTLNLGGDGILSLSIAPASSAANTRSDIDGNGISDVLFQYTGGDNQTGYWMNGKDEWRSSNCAHPVEWTLLGAYDMDSDGIADSVFVGNGVEVDGVKGAYIGYYKGGVDTDDNWVNIHFLENEEENVWLNKIGNLTGNPDKNSIVWHCAGLGALGVWTDGTSSWTSLGAGFDSNWTMIGCGDFNGDGRDSVVMSYLGGVKYYAIGLDGSAVDMGSLNWGGWEVRAIGDFAGDGKDDMILFHKEYGAVVMIADGNLDNYTAIGQLDAKDWFIVGCGDYDGDRKDDLLVRQYSSGMLGYYSSGDTSKWVELGRGVDMDWTVIA